MARSFRSPSSPPLGVPPANPTFQTPDDCPSIATPRSPGKPVAFRMLSWLQVELEGVFERLADDCLKDPDLELWAELQYVALIAEIERIKAVVAAPVLPPDPLIDVEDLQAVYDLLRDIDGYDDMARENLIVAKRTLVELMKRGVQS